MSCVRRANENAGNLISVVQFLIILIIHAENRNLGGQTLSVT